MRNRARKVPALFYLKISEITLLFSKTVIYYISIVMRVHNACAIFYYF